MLSPFWFSSIPTPVIPRQMLGQYLDTMLQPLSSTSFLIHNSLSYHFALFVPVAQTTASNGRVWLTEKHGKPQAWQVCILAEIWTKCWTQVKPEPICLVTENVLSELLTWLSKQLKKLKIHYRPDTHKGHFSNTATIWPQNICWQCHLNMKQTL
jgi:hypothetical protein